MNKSLNLIIILIFITGCSFNKNSKFWTNSEIINEDDREDVNYVEVFPKEEALKKEFNSGLRLKFTSKTASSTSDNNYLNNNGRLNFDGSLKKSSRYKFSKIKNFDQYQPEISFYRNNVLFFDNKGSILKFNNESKLIWKKN